MKEWTVPYGFQNETIRGSDTYQDIRYGRDPNGGEDLVPYVRYRNQRLYLDDFTVSPNGYERESKIIGTEIHAAFCDSFFSAYLLHLSEDGDQAKVYFSMI
jgi:hypothetical protein